MTLMPCLVSQGRSLQRRFNWGCSFQRRFYWQRVNHFLLTQEDFPTLLASRRSTLIDDNVHASYLRERKGLQKGLETVMHYHLRHYPEVRRYMLDNPDIVLRDADAITADIAMHYAQLHGIDMPPGFTGRVYSKSHANSIYISEEKDAEPRLHVRPICVSPSGKVMIQQLAFFKDGKDRTPGYEAFYIIVNAKSVPTIPGGEEVGEIWEREKKQPIVASTPLGTPNRELSVLMPHEKNANGTVFGGFLTHKIRLETHTFAFETLLPFAKEKNMIYDRNSQFYIQYNDFSLGFVEKTMPMQLCSLKLDMLGHSPDLGLISIRAVIESGGTILVEALSSLQYDVKHYSPPKLTKSTYKSTSRIVDALLMASRHIK